MWFPSLAILHFRTPRQGTCSVRRPRPQSLAKAGLGILTAPSRLTLWCGSLLLAANLPAADDAGQSPKGLAVGSDQPPRLAVAICPGEVVGREQVLRPLIRSGTNEFVFVLPDGLRAENAPDGRLVLSSRSLRFHLCLRLLPPLGAGSEAPEALRRRAAAQYANSTDLEEYATTVAGCEGRGFELQHTVPQVGRRFARLLWVPFKAGLMEFVLDADAANAPAARAAMDMVLLTFCSNEHGPLQIARRGEQS